MLSTCTRLIQSIPSHTPHYTVAIDATSSHIVSGDTSGRICLHDLATMFTLAGDIHAHSRGAVAALASVESSHMCVSGGADGVKCFDTREFAQPVMELDCKDVLSVSVSSTDRHIACGLDSGEVVVWDIRKQKRPKRVLDSIHSDKVSSVCFHPTRSKTLLTGSLDSLVCVLDLKEKDEDEVLTSVFNVEDLVTRVGFFGPSSQHAYTISETGILSLWSLESEERVAHFPQIRTEEEVEGPVTASRVDILVDCLYEQSSQRLYLVSGSHAGHTQLSNVNTERVARLANLQSGHTAPVRCVCAAPAGTTGWGFATGGEDGCVRVWGMEEAVGRQLAVEEPDVAEQALPKKKRKSKQ